MILKARPGKALLPLALLWLLSTLAEEASGAAAAKRRSERPASGSQCPRPDEIAPCQCRTRGPTIQVRCTNSMMGRITEAMINVRRYVDAVDVLILEGNNINHLPSRAFGSVPVNRLFLEGNRMKSIDRNAFAGVENHISEIYIKEPELQILPVDSVDYLKELTVLSVEDSQITDLPRVAGLQRLKLFKVDGSRIRHLTPDSFKNLPALSYLHITQSQISRLDIGVLESLTNLLMANFSSNELTWVHPRAFRYMEQLQEVILRGNKLRDAGMVGRAMRVAKALKRLDLSHNEVQDLDQGSFMDTIGLEELVLSHNRLTELKRGSLHRLPRLRTVDLSHNRIKTFHSDSFMETPLVEKLLLKRNALAYVTDISFIMDALPKLNTLDLADNEIRDIPFGALRGYPALQRLMLSNNQISHVSREALADLPSLEELDLSRNKLIADAMDGPIFDLPRLISLDLSFNKLSKLSGELLSSLSQLQRLDISHNGITVVSQGALHKVNLLTFLNISHNSIKEFKNNTFSGLTGLKELDASYNEILALPDEMLSQQKELERAFFAHNHIQTVSAKLLPQDNKVESLDMTSNFVSDFPEELISAMPKLKRLYFGRNAIKHLGKLSFANLKDLEVIDMHDNRIETIEDEAFKDLSALKTLDLSLNIISTVGDNLEPMTNLVKLNLSDNYITSLPKNAFHSLTRLSTLDISNNTIVEIGKAFVGMRELKYLDLSYNHLPVVKEGAFKDLPSLLSLHLHHNSIAELQSGAFQALSGLESLTLNNNGIARVRKETFIDLPSLETLTLDENVLEDVDDRSFVDLYSLRELGMQHNLLKDINERAFVRIPSLRHLNMSFNLIRDLPRHGFRGLETLETVDLSYNDLREVDESAFEDMKWLYLLKLNDNNICRIRSGAFSGANSLRSLNLSNNRLSRIQEDSFGETRQLISSLDVAGNPLSCDCDSLWLRNLATDTGSESTADEPRCYFPKELSGSPLRKLRSSRFSCETGRSGGGGAAEYRHDNLLRDACSGIPLKMPPQQALQEESEAAAATSTTEMPRKDQDAEKSSGLSQGEETTTDATNPAQNSESDKPKEASANSVGDSIDNDGVDVGSDKVGGGNDGEFYEYYYVYYDEKGNPVNMTDGNGKKSQSKVKETNAVPTPAVSDDKKTGDTPTIYAQIQDPDKDGGTDDKKGQSGSGMSIFGIPIPKLPISLDFASFMPSLSGGLLPLPVGRKGEGQEESKQSAGAGIATATPGKIEKNAQKKPEADQTRGPDFLDPIWVETGLNGLKMASEFILPALAATATSTNLGGGQSKESAAEVDSKTDKREIKPDMNAYKQPINPPIPLGGEATSAPAAKEEKRYYPTDPAQQQQSGEYFPKGYIPAIQFDHPVPAGSSGGPLPILHPVLPPPEEGQEAPAKSPPRRHVSSAKGAGGNNNIVRDTVDGFQPLFRPHNFDPMMKSQPAPNSGSGSKKSKKRRPQPQVEDEDVGSTAVEAPYPLDPEEAESVRVKKLPVEFTSPANDIVTSDSTSPDSIVVSASSTVGDPVPAVPDQREITNDRKMSSSPRPAPNNSSEEYEYEYEYVYETEKPSSETASTDASSQPVAAVSTEKEIDGLLEELRESAVTTMASTTTNRVVPTLQVEEISSTEEVDPDSVAVTHRGTPRTSTDEAITTTSNKANIEEYTYEYYEEEAGKSTSTTDSSTNESAGVSASTDEGGKDGFSLQNLFGLLAGGRTTPRPPAPVTDLAEDNLVESQRSSVTVDSVVDVLASQASIPIQPLRYSASSTSEPDPRVATDRADDGAGSSSPYPFHPDRLDPAHRPNSDSSLEWYYETYNGDDDREPFVGEKREGDIELANSAKKRSSPSSIVAVALATIMALGLR